MEENKNWEQPQDESIIVEQKQEKQSDVEEKKEQEIQNQNGSQYGKFKDAESLLEAYNNLQAEFTRKCQKLSELEKTQQIETVPVFDKEDWQNRVSDFVNTHSEAKKFASEISQEILANPSLQTKEDALEIAWARVLGKNYKGAEEMVNDDKFVDDFVLKSDQIKQKVLSSYIKELDLNLPPFVTASSGGDIAFTTNPKPSTLSEAKQLVEAIFNIKREN